MNLWQPYIRYKANLTHYRVLVVLVYPSPYGDNLDKEEILEVLY